MQILNKFVSSKNLATPGTHELCLGVYVVKTSLSFISNYLLLKFPCHSPARIRAVGSSLVWVLAVCVKQNDVSPLKCVILPFPYSVIFVTKPIFVSIPVPVFFLSCAVKFILLARQINRNFSTSIIYCERSLILLS